VTTLSPQALEILEAAQKYEINPECYSRQIAATTLRTASEHLKKEKGWSLGVRWSADELLAIAHQLEPELDC
jgi:hypothetical protein